MSFSIIFLLHVDLAILTAQVRVDIVLSTLRSQFPLQKIIAKLYPVPLTMDGTQTHNLVRDQVRN